MLDPIEAVGALYLNPKEEISVTFYKFVFTKKALMKKEKEKRRDHISMKGIKKFL